LSFLCKKTNSDFLSLQSCLNTSFIPVLVSSDKRDIYYNRDIYWSSFVYKKLCWMLEGHKDKQDTLLATRTPKISLERGDSARNVKLWLQCGQVPCKAWIHF
jgi:hypothetical protein